MKLDLKKLLPPLASWKYMKLKESQVVFFELESGLTIKLTLADSVFEWYLDIYNRQNDLILNHWYDLYGDTEEKLMIELESEIKKMVTNITNHKSRVCIETKWPYVLKTFQILKNEMWVDLISQKNFKLF